MSDDEEYRIVTVDLQQLRINSIMVKVPNMVDWQSIPRSLIHGGDNLKLLRHQHSLPMEMTLRIMAWKADQLHLAGAST